MIHCEFCEQSRPAHADDCPRVLYSEALRLPVDPEED